MEDLLKLPFTDTEQVMTYRYKLVKNSGYVSSLQICYVLPRSVW